MKATMAAASMRDSERMRVVRTAFVSDGLDQPGGRYWVSLTDDDGGGMVARSSTGRSPVEVEAEVS